MAKVKVSVGNLALRMVVPETGKTVFFGILNRKAFEKGRRMVAATGGAAELTEKGQGMLQSCFGATDFEGKDARFVIDEEHLDAVFKVFESRDPETYEINPLREIREELATKELPIQNSPVLSRDEVSQIKVRFVKTIRQKFSGCGTSARESAGMPTRRLFNLFEIVVSSAIFEKMKSSEAIYILSEGEMASTDGGARKGRAADGAELADNLIWV